MGVQAITILLCSLLAVKRGQAWWYTTAASEDTTSTRSCRYNCGYHHGTCSCRSSCWYYGNCCHDYNMYCGVSTEIPHPPVPTAEDTTSARSCRYNCGYHLGTCSCQSSCWYYGNCCHDYNMYCGVSTESPHPPVTTAWWYTTAASFYECGGNRYGSGSFSSPYYPNSYHNNAYCVWQIAAASGHGVLLTFTDVELENCCGCDYIAVYDGPSQSSRPLGKICFNGTHEPYRSSSTYLTVLFRSDSSVVRRGFRADYTSTLLSSSGRVDCSSGSMNIIIRASYLSGMGLSGHDLYLEDPNCRPKVSPYEAEFSFGLNSCGTKQELMDGRVVYTNTVQGSRSQPGGITRQSHLTLRVQCRMEPDATAQIMYVARQNATGNITGSGRFNITMGFYTSPSFYYPVHDSPYVVDPNQRLYVQAKLGTPARDVVLFLDTCVASPSAHDFLNRSYDLVRNGCKRDSTYYAYSSLDSEAVQFRFQAFSFLFAHPEVYLQCKVAVCRAYDYNSRCYRGCQTRKARSLRPAADGGTTSVILGPIQLSDRKNAEENLPEEGVVQTEA